MNIGLTRTGGLELFILDRVFEGFVLGVGEIWGIWGLANCDWWLAISCVNSIRSQETIANTKPSTPIVDMRSYWCIYS